MPEAKWEIEPTCFPGSQLLGLRHAGLTAAYGVIPPAASAGEVMAPPSILQPHREHVWGGKAELKFVLT